MNRLQVEYEKSEAAQESGFMNATLQSNASNTLAFSIAVHAPPLEIDDQYQLAFVLGEAFQPLIDKGYTVEVQVGPAREADGADVTGVNEQLAPANPPEETIDPDIFTPYESTSSGTRVVMSISPEDRAKIHRGTWSATVTDKLSGAVVDVRDADCGAGCRCAAEIVRVVSGDISGLERID